MSAPEDEAGATEHGSEDAREEAEFDPRMLEALVCPLTQDRLEWDAERSELVSRKVGLAYPVRGGIPIMLEAEARRLDD